MNHTYVAAGIAGKAIEDYSGIVFSRVVYDNKMPILHIMSMAEALRQRKGDMLRIAKLTEKAKGLLEQINRR